MANFYRDNEDLQFYATVGLPWEPLVDLTELGYKDPDGHASFDEAMQFYGETLDLVGGLVATELAPYAAELDRAPVELHDGEVKQAPAMDRFFKKVGELGLHGLCVPRELDGMNAPLATYMLSAEMFARGDVGAMTHHSFHGGMAMAMLVYSIHEGSTRFGEDGRIAETRFANEIKDIASGNAWGCMDITEPHAGSDMAALRTRADQDADGNWRLNGQKIYITSGHGKYHFVVAKTSPEESLDSLSFFLVPAYEDTKAGRKRYATVGRVEEKMGHHSSATCQIHFENTPAQLVGKTGEGFKQMLILMNNARVGVSFESIGLCENAYRQAKEYAAQRPSMGRMIAHHELVAEMLDNMETDIRGLRALAAHCAWQEEMAQKLRIAERHPMGSLAGEMKQLGDRCRFEARRTTPLAKYLCSEKAVEISRNAIQVHGGAGYTKDYGAEKLMRDAMVLPIYEGTSQIQSLMSMKDSLMGMIQRPGEFADQMARNRVRSLTGKGETAREVARMRYAVCRAQQYLLTRTAADKLGQVRGLPLKEWRRNLTTGWDPKRDFSWAMLHAERLIRMESFTTIAELLLQQAQEHPSRQKWADRWVERYSAQVQYELDRVLHSGSRLLDELAHARG